MRRTSNRLRRWASISALASAALAASAGSGEAAIVYQRLGGVGPDASMSLPGGNYIAVRRSGTRDVITSATHVNRYGPKGGLKTVAGLEYLDAVFSGDVLAEGVSFRNMHGTIALANKGQLFSQVGTGVGRTGRLARLATGLFQQGVFVTYLYGPRLHRFPFWSGHGYQRSNSAGRTKVEVRTNGGTSHGVGRIDFYRTSQFTRYSLAGQGTEYVLFRFDVGSQTDYGWLELALGNPGGSGPFVRLIGYAYDTDGQPIPAGALPEPQRLPLALGALALGAVGVREWRKKRRAAT